MNFVYRTSTTFSKREKVYKYTAHDLIPHNTNVFIITNIIKILILTTNQSDKINNKNNLQSKLRERERERENIENDMTTTVKTHGQTKKKTISRLQLQISLSFKYNMLNIICRTSATNIFAAFIQEILALFLFHFFRVFIPFFVTFVRQIFSSQMIVEFAITRFFVIQVII